MTQKYKPQEGDLVFMNDTVESPLRIYVPDRDGKGDMHVPFMLVDHGIAHLEESILMMIGAKQRDDIIDEWITALKALKHS